MWWVDAANGRKLVGLSSGVTGSESWGTIRKYEVWSVIHSDEQTTVTPWGPSHLPQIVFTLFPIIKLQTNWLVDPVTTGWFHLALWRITFQTSQNQLLRAVWGRCSSVMSLTAGEHPSPWIQLPISALVPHKLVSSLENLRSVSDEATAGVLSAAATPALSTLTLHGLPTESLGHLLSSPTVSAPLDLIYGPSYEILDISVNKTKEDLSRPPFPIVYQGEVLKRQLTFSLVFPICSILLLASLSLTALPPPVYSPGSYLFILSPSFSNLFFLLRW